MDKRIIDIVKEYENKINKFTEVYNNLDDYDKLEVLMDYLDDNNLARPYSMDCFDELMEGEKPLKIAQLIDKDFCVYDDMFWFDGYGKVHSGDISDSLKEFDDMDFNWLNDNYWQYSCFDEYKDELGAIIDKYYDVAEELGIDVPAIEDFENEYEKYN